MEIAGAKEENKVAVEAVAEADEKKVAVEFSEEGLVEDEDEEMEKIVDSIGSMSLEEKKHNRGSAMKKRNAEVANAKKSGRPLVDLFETRSQDIQFIVSKMIEEREKGKRCWVWEPCCGNNAIVNELRKQGFTVHASDLNFGDVRVDYLTTDVFPDFDFIITNPPYSGKINFIKRGVDIGKPFAMLLPVDVLSSTEFADLVQGCDFQVGILIPMPKFLHEGKVKRYGPCGWYFFNWKVSDSNIFYIRTNEM